MNDHDVLDALKESMDGVTMHTPVQEIVTAARRRRTRRRIIATAGVTAAGLALGVPLLTHPSTAPPGSELDTGGGSVHVQTAAYSVDSLSDGNVRVTWSKENYFKDHAGLQAALRRAGLPVLIKVGTFCKGPDDQGSLNPSGVGDGVDKVMTGQSDGKGVTFLFKPAAMPPGKQLFIGYLNEAQLARTGGNPGSVERLVPASGPLTCTTQAPPAHRVPGEPGGKPAPKPGS